MTSTQTLEAVKRRLRQSARGDLMRRGVSAVYFDQGDLVLQGELDEVADKKVALEQAAAAPGVDLIVDRIHLACRDPRPDAAVLDAVRATLRADPGLAGCLVQSSSTENHSPSSILSPEGWQGAIDIRVADGVVTLDGEVPTLAQKRLAGALAWWVSGCREVVNGLEVEPPEIDDSDKLAGDVRLVLGRSRQPSARVVRVTVTGRVVTLEGDVASAADARAIERDVWSIFGVDAVVNALSPREEVVGPHPPPGP